MSGAHRQRLRLREKAIANATFYAGVSASPASRQVLRRIERKARKKLLRAEAREALKQQLIAHRALRRRAAA